MTSENQPSECGAVDEITTATCTREDGHPDNHRDDSDWGTIFIWAKNPMEYLLKSTPDYEEFPWFGLYGGTTGYEEE